jgi:hypothetical protein
MSAVIVGRPTLYTQEIADLICTRLADGESLRAICRDESLPARCTVITWKNTNEEFCRQYARARDDQVELYADEIIDISDDSTNDYVRRTAQDGSTEMVLDHEHITRSRLRVDSRKWLLSKLKPGTYGDKIQHAPAAGDDNRLKVIVEFVGDPAPAAIEHAPQQRMGGPRQMNSNIIEWKG